MAGDADIASTAALLGDRARARMVAALGDGRALAASVLACEAGVAASTASEHLARLVDGGLLTVERHGRHRYFRLAGPDVARMLEAMARVSPPARVTSLREGTRANALRTARTCYDHLAGRLGTGLTAAMISGGLITGGDGVFDPSSARRDRLSSRGHDVTYELTADGRRVLHSLGVSARSIVPQALRRLLRRLERAAPSPLRSRGSRAARSDARSGLDHSPALRKGCVALTGGGIRTRSPFRARGGSGLGAPAGPGARRRLSYGRVGGAPR